MSDTAVHRSFPRSMRQVDMWIWLTLHLYAILCLAGAGDLSPVYPLAALCLLQFILAPALLIYVLITRPGLTRNALLAAVSAVLFLLAATTIYLASRGHPHDEFDYAAFWVFFGGIISPFIIVAGLLIWNVFAILGLLKEKRVISAVLVFLVSLVLAGLTFSPKDWMWREVPWGLYYAAVDKFEGWKDAGKSAASIRKIRSELDVLASMSFGGGGASCMTELYYVRSYSSRNDLLLQIDELLGFPSRDAFDPPSGIVHYAKNIAPGYVLAYACY